MRKKDKLYTVNRWNKNLFWDGSQMGTRTTNNASLGTKTSPVTNFFGGSDYNVQAFPSVVSVPSGTQWRPSTTARINSALNGMDSNWRNNVGQMNANFGSGNWLSQSLAQQASANLFNGDNGSGNGKGESGEGSTFGSTAKAVGAAAAQAGSTPFTIDGRTYKRGMFDAMDPFYHAGDVTFSDGSKGHIENGVGDVFSTAGVGVFQGGASAANPYVMLAGAALKSVGDIINNGWGYAYNDNAINKVKSNTANMRRVGRAMTGLDTTDDLLEGASNMGTALGYSAGDLVKGGVFTKGKAKKKGQEIIDAEQEAGDYLNYAFLTGVQNQAKKARDLVSGSSFAFGGGLGGRTTILPYGIQDNDGNNMGAIEYDFMSEWLANKRRQAEKANGLAGKVQGTAFDFGGILQSNSSDFGTGLIHIDAGGTHEESPYDGVQMGVDQNGTPNLVEEGEVVYDDYVYSNRILCDLTTKKKFHISKNRDITYAELAKKLEKEISERPNDAVSKAGFEKQMEALADEQERQKAEMEAERAKAAFEALSPEEQVAVIQQHTQQQAEEELAMAAQQMAGAPSQEEMLMAQQQEAAQQQAMMGGSQAMAEQPQVMSEGGHLFPWGGYENLFSVKPPYASSNSAGFIPYDRALTPEEVMKLEQEQRFIDWTNYVNEHWDEDYVQNYLKALDKAAGGNHLFDKEGKILATAKDYFNNARTKNHLWGYYHLTPEQIAEEAVSQKPSGRVYHAVVGDDDYLEGDPSTWRGVGAEARREVLPNGDTVIYHNRLLADGVVQRPGEADKSPVGDVDMSASARAKGDGEGSSGTGTGTGSVKFERSPLSWLRYAPALGGAIGLFNNILNKPDYSRAQAVIDYARDTEANGARVMPRFIGDYLRYNPLDIWYAQNNMNAQSRATDRALMNNTAPTRMAGLLANGYNSQIASGNLFRQAQEYNDNLRHQVADFNRRTNMFNAEADMNAQRTNASLRQDNRRMGLQGLITGYKMMDDLDDRRSASMSANLTNLMQSIGNIGEEEYDMDRLKWLEKTGVLRSKVYSGAKGGSLKRKKGKRGLTY